MAKQPYLIPSILFILSFMLRLSLITNGPYNVDCLNLALKAEEVITKHYLPYLYGSGYPLAILLGAMFVSLLKIFSINDPVVAVNLMSITFGALCIPVFFLITKKLFNGLTALIASIILSCSPIFLSISVYGMSHTPALFFTLLSILFMLKYYNSTQIQPLIFSAICIGLTGATRLQEMVPMILPLGFICILKHFNIDLNSSKRDIYKNISIFLITAVLTAAVFYIPYFTSNIRQEYLYQLTKYKLTSVGFNVKEWKPEYFLSNIKELYLNFRYRSIYFLIMAFSGVGLITVVFGLILIAKKETGIFIFLLLWILPFIVFYSMLFTTSPRFYTIILPPMIIAEAYILTHLIKSPQIWAKTIGLIMFLYIFLSRFCYAYPVLLDRHKVGLLVNYSKWIAEKTEKNAYIITTDESPFIRYYGHRKTIGRPLGYFSLNEKEINIFKQQLNKMLKENIPVYITSNAIYVYDPKHQFSTLLKKNYKLDYIGTKICEYWHRGIFKRLLYNNALFRIRQK